MKHLIVLAMVITMTGCSWFVKEPEIRYVTKTEYVTINLNKPLRANCTVTPPISETGYMMLKPEEREAYLTDYVIVLYGDIRNCDQLRAKIVEVIDKTNQLYKDNEDEGQSKD